MFVSIFKSNNKFLIVLLFIIGLFIWIKYFFYPVTPLYELSKTEFLYNNVVLAFILSNPKLSTIIAFGLLFLQSVVFNNIIVNFSLVDRNSFLPAFVYFVLMSMLPAHMFLNKVLVFNTFLLLSLNYIFKLYHFENQYKEVFNAAFLISFASLMYFSAVFYLFFILICFMVYGLFHWREWIITFLGFVTPYIFVLFYFFWTDKTYPFSWEIFIENSDKLVFNLETISISLVLLLSVISMFYYKSLDSERVIMLRKYASILVLLFVFSLLTLFNSPQWNNHFMVAVIPSSIFISTYLIKLKKQWISELIIFVLLFVVLINHFSGS